MEPTGWDAKQASRKATQPIPTRHDFELEHPSLTTPFLPHSSISGQRNQVAFIPGTWFAPPIQNPWPSPFDVPSLAWPKAASPPHNMRILAPGSLSSFTGAGSGSGPSDQEERALFDTSHASRADLFAGKIDMSLYESLALHTSTSPHFVLPPSCSALPETTQFV